MVESDLIIEKVEESATDSFRRAPSFSGWCDDNDIAHSAQLGNARTLTDDFDFELPLVNQNSIGNGSVNVDTQDYNFKQRMKGGGDLGVASTGNGKDRYVPFDVENGPTSNHTYPNASQTISKNVVSVADVLKTLFLVLVWYTFSTFLTLYNKTLLGDHLGRFPAPLLMNTFHFAMQAILSKGITWFWSRKFQPTVMMTWRDYFLRVVPTALSTAMDVNLSNASLVFISVTFATMCKSAAPIFLLLFAFVFRLESPSLKLLGIMLIISIGVLLTVAKETEFEFWGFIFVMLAAVMSGFRWTMTQILLQKEIYGLKNPLTLMSYVTPVMALSTAMLSLIFDPWQEFGSSSYFDSSWHITRSCLLMLFGGTLAFFMVLTEYILVSVTSAVTVTIAGVVKEAVTIVVAVFYFHDKFTWMKGIGLLTIMLGVSLFNWYKYDKLQKGNLSEDEMSRSSTQNAAAKYVILEEWEDQDDDP
ncbi:probable sugar phosphate/phosphate translocator At1g06470 [Lycium barbarum]|uniref:probable sugar phosphate/phosphate translocator At1g06470 n=1 Tax=Lycium barbarum TaxID=112863 RepID=UPI00293E378D|nr:probable sugar phosphate/phosphate translocator At1g06470 [Lycium barbarum]XP_060190966.1 probable sugar phosphate/phosphate translocator At1g06470 [Lycium barbarum]